MSKFIVCVEVVDATVATCISVNTIVKLGQMFLMLFPRIKSFGAQWTLAECVVVSLFLHMFFKVHLFCNFRPACGASQNRKIQIDNIFVKILLMVMKVLDQLKLNSRITHKTPIKEFAILVCSISYLAIFLPVLLDIFNCCARKCFTSVADECSIAVFCF